jgi:PAS domain S-box-containing protein
VVAVRILLLADSDDAATWLAATLGTGGLTATCERAADEASARAQLAEEPWDLVVASFAGPRPPLALGAVRDRITGVDPPLVIVADRFEDVAEAALRLGAGVCRRGEGFAHLGPALERAARERTSRSEPRDGGFADGQRQILESIAAGRPLGEVLERIVTLIEAQGDGMLCSILLLDEDGQRLRHGAAPHLPRTLIEGIDGAQIGPGEGSCGAAAYLGAVVVVEDIGTHPNWVRYQHLAIPFGLRACWSTPISAAPGGEVLGTFAMYYRAARKPTARERRWVERATHLAFIAISRERTERAVRQLDARYRQIVDTAYEGVWLLDADARTLLVNGRTARMLGYEADELLGRRIVEFMDDASRAAAEGTFIQRLRTASEQFEFRFRRQDGTSFWALVAGSPIHDQKQEVVGALAMITDITELKQTEEALRRSEAELRVVFDNAALGMALVDAGGRVSRSNPALQQFLGHPEAELEGRPFADLVHPEDRQAGLELHRSLLAGERDFYQIEARCLRRDGAVVWGRMSASLVRTAGQGARSAIMMLENVTERRRMEEAVRSSERLRTLMYSAVSDTLFYIGVERGPRFRFLSINPAFSRATGLREDQVIGRPVEEVIPEPSRALVLEQYARAIQQRRTVTWDEVSVYPAGTRYGEVSITPIFDGDGHCTNLVGTVHDVTERRLTEERLAAQAALLDKAKDAILVVDLDGSIQYWNKGAERLYGWSSEEALGRRVLDLIHRDVAAFEAGRRRMVEAGEWSGELAQVTKEGRPIVAEVSATLIRDGEGRARSVFAIGTDITERKRLEVQVFHNQRLESLGTLAGGIAHDFNNLLSAILGNLEFALQELPQDHRAREPLAEIGNASRWGVELVRQLLTFSRRDESRRRRVELQPLVNEALGLLRAALPRSTRVETRLGSPPPEILADPVQIRQIVMNLGSNAAHAMSGPPSASASSGVIEVQIDRVVLERELAARSTVLLPGTYARLTVTDSGCGIDAATLDRIFDPFYTTKEPGRGTGLGLSVVHGIVRNHDGGIVVESTPGQGTSFSVYFPAAPPREGRTPETAAGRSSP